MQSEMFKLSWQHVMSSKPSNHNTPSLLQYLPLDLPIEASKPCKLGSDFLWEIQVRHTTVINCCLLNLLGAVSSHVQSVFCNSVSHLRAEHHRRSSFGGRKKTGPWEQGTPEEPRVSGEVERRGASLFKEGLIRGTDHESLLLEDRTIAIPRWAGIFSPFLCHFPLSIAT